MKKFNFNKFYIIENIDLFHSSIFFFIVCVFVSTHVYVHMDTLWYTGKWAVWWLILCVNFIGLSDVQVTKETLFLGTSVKVILKETCIWISSQWTEFINKTVNWGTE